MASRIAIFSTFIHWQGTGYFFFIKKITQLYQTSVPHKIIIQMDMNVSTMNISKQLKEDLDKVEVTGGGAREAPRHGQVHSTETRGKDQDSLYNQI